MRFDFSYLDMAFINGQIVTVNEKDEICQAVGIKKNKIVFVGTDEEIRRIIDEKTKVIDLKGRTMCPGFIDSPSCMPPSAVCTLLAKDTIISL